MAASSRLMQRNICKGAKSNAKSSLKSFDMTMLESVTCLLGETILCFPQLLLGAFPGAMFLAL